MHSLSPLCGAFLRLAVATRLMTRLFCSTPLRKRLAAARRSWTVWAAAVGLALPALADGLMEQQALISTALPEQWRDAYNLGLAVLIVVLRVRRVDSRARCVRGRPFFKQP